MVETKFYFDSSNTSMGFEMDKNIYVGDTTIININIFNYTYTVAYKNQQYRS